MPKSKNIDPSTPRKESVKKNVSINQEEPQKHDYVINSSQFMQENSYFEEPNQNKIQKSKFFTQKYKYENNTSNDDGDVKIQKSCFLKSKIDESQRITLNWKNLNFSIKNRNNYIKNIIKNSNGILKPGQLNAIMGPSGCGKTTLLSLLAGRKNIIKDPDFIPTTMFSANIQEGQILANNRSYTNDDFCEFGAYVQQDDILMATMTPRELYTFACQMRTSLNNTEIENRVNNLLEVMKLESCQNTFVGNELIKGISGGERKRASIGYELITNPRLLILDEPTSGLDSNTAFKLIQMLKKESERGMSIILTIHQPSSEIFMLFDKITLLSDGNTLYDGSPKDVFSFYNKLDLTIEKYVNPSDELLKLANNPQSYNQQLTPEVLFEKVQIIQNKQEPNELINQKEVFYFDYKKNNQNSWIRRASFIKQFFYMCKRNIQNVLRNPQGIRALLIISLFQSILMGVVFQGVGNERLYSINKVKRAYMFSPKKYKTYMKHNIQVLKDYNGFVFFVATDQFISISIGQAMQMPEISRVYMREMQNKMYSPSAFYLSKWIISTLVYSFQPIIYSFAAFICVQFNDDSIENFSQWLIISIILSVSGSSLGLLFGTLITNHTNTIVFLNIFLFILYFSSGIFANLSAGKNFIVDKISPLSPFTYAVELKMRLLLSGLECKDQVIQNFSSNKGFDYCVNCLLLISFTFFISGWIAQVVKSKMIF